MVRNFGLVKMTSGTAPRGVGPQSRSPRGDTLPRLPLNSILPADAPLPRGKVTQALCDVLALLGAFLLVSATGCGLAFSVFVLLFVRF